MRRLPLAVAAAAAALAAVPAAAYEAPRHTCATYLAFADTERPGTSCTSGNAPQLGGLVTFRVFHVEVAAGTVRADLTCRNTWWSSSDSAVFDASTDVQTIEVVEDAGMTCTATLTPLTFGATAAGFTTFTYRYPYGGK